jgi:hypothetical protein
MQNYLCHNRSGGVVALQFSNGALACVGNTVLCKGCLIDSLLEELADGRVVFSAPAGSVELWLEAVSSTQAGLRSRPDEFLVDAIQVTG